MSHLLADNIQLNLYKFIKTFCCLTALPIKKKLKLNQS